MFLGNVDNNTRLRGIIPRKQNPHSHGGKNLKPQDNVGFPFNKQKGGWSNAQIKQ
jgi:hypothetical protein